MSKPDVPKLHEPSALLPPRRARLLDVASYEMANQVVLGPGVVEEIVSEVPEEEEKKG